MDVSDRRMQVQLTPEAKIAAEFLFYQSDFCVCGLCQRSAPLPFGGGGFHSRDLHCFLLENTV